MRHVDGSPDARHGPDPWDAFGVQAARGLHPLAIERRRKVAPLKTRRDDVGLMSVVAGVLVFLSVFAYGLRLVDQKYGETVRTMEPAPLEQEEGTMFGYLSQAARSVFGVKTVHAAEFDAMRYKAAPTDRFIELEAAPGETVPVEIWYRNLGSVTWSPEGRRYLSIYTTQPRYHSGIFRHASWLTAGHPAKLATPSVPPGEMGVVKFLAKAPDTPGVYDEWVQLAAEDTAWVWGAHVNISMTVRPKPASSVSVPDNSIQVPEPPTTVTTAPAPASNDVSAKLLLTSARRISSKAYVPLEYTAAFKNAGGKTWDAYGLRFREYSGTVVADGDLSHSSWSSDMAVEVREPLPPGHLGFLTVKLMTPDKRGDYTVRFDLVVDGETVDGAVVEVPVTVTNDHIAPTPSAPAPVPDSGSATVPIPSEGGVEPDIRVGLYTTETPETLAADGPFEARSADGTLLASFNAGDQVQFWYDHSAGLYRLTNGIITQSSSSPIRFETMNTGGIFTLISHEDRPSWNTSINYNRYRGAFELRKNDRNSYVWLINELPMSDYLKGIKETSNISPAEYQKALATAARTYAMWHYVNPGKHWHFTVDAKYDQVYKGYASEITMPRFADAVDATRGQVVAYEGEMVVTPYFSSSDGRTRAYTEVWGGTHKPWLVSVTAQYDAAAGRPLNGHGVGLSAWDALERANDGWTHDRILNYFYSGTTLRKLYN